MIIVLGCSLSPKEHYSLLYETWTDYPHLQTEVLRKPVKTDVTTAVHAINVEAVMSPPCLYLEISQVSV